MEHTNSNLLSSRLSAEFKSLLRPRPVQQTYGAVASSYRAGMQPYLESPHRHGHAAARSPRASTVFTFYRPENQISHGPVTDMVNPAPPFLRRLSIQVCRLRRNPGPGPSVRLPHLLIQPSARILGACAHSRFTIPHHYLCASSLLAPIHLPK